MNPRPGTDTTLPLEKAPSNSNLSNETAQVAEEAAPVVNPPTEQEQSQLECLSDLEQLPFAEATASLTELRENEEQKELEAINFFMQQLEDLAKKQNKLRDYRSYAQSITSCLGNLSFFKSPADLDASHTKTMLLTAGTVLGAVKFFANAFADKATFGPGAVMLTSAVLLAAHAFNDFGAKSEHIHAIDEAKELQVARNLLRPA